MAVNPLLLKAKNYQDKARSFIKRKPFTTFISAFGLLFLILILSNLIAPKSIEQPKPQPIKTVQTYNIGEAPKVTFQAKIEKSGVVKIMAQAPGIVQNIAVGDGDKVWKGQQLITLSSNYQGGNAPALQAQIAQTQYQNTLDTFDQQKDAINKQKDLANINHDNFTQMQSIATASASDTNSLINANQSILDQLNQQLTDSQNNGASTSAIQQQQSMINQLQAGQNQLKQALRTTQEQTDSSKAPGRLADTQRDLTLEQLNLQEKSLDLNKEVQRLQSALAAVGAASMYPATPIAGTVERIYVHVGDSVKPGTLLAVVTSPTPQSMAVVGVPQTVAKHISIADPSILHLGTHLYTIKPTYISQEATDGTLYSVFFTLPEDDNDFPTDGQYINVDLAVGSANTGSTVPFVPIDAVYQTQDKAYLLVVINNQAQTREITLGQVYGNYVQIQQGLKSGDQVILDRNIVAGDKIKTQ